MTREHKLFTTPVSVNDGLRRSDRRTWSILLIGAAVALAFVFLINLFVEKPKIHWPTSAGPVSPASPAAQPAEPSKDDSEPRTFNVAPPGAVPPPRSQ